VTDASNSGATYAAFLSPPTPAGRWSLASKAKSIGADMNNSPYLDLPLSPLAVALPRMLEKVAVELTAAGPVEAQGLRQRAELILDLLTPRLQSPISS